MGIAEWSPARIVTVTALWLLVVGSYGIWRVWRVFRLVRSVMVDKGLGAVSVGLNTRALIAFAVVMLAPPIVLIVTWLRTRS